MKICGCKEKCFRNGVQYGHFEGSLCYNLGEITQDGKQVMACFDSEPPQEVTCYSTENEYNLIKQQNERSI